MTRQKMQEEKVLSKINTIMTVDPRARFFSFNFTLEQRML